MAGEGSLPRKWKEQFFWNEKAAGNGSRGGLLPPPAPGIASPLHISLPLWWECAQGGDSISRGCWAPSWTLILPWWNPAGLCRSTRTSESWTQSPISACTPNARSVGIRAVRTRKCSPGAVWKGRKFTLSKSSQETESSGGKKKKAWFLKSDNCLLAI